jgi:LysM repeat protein
MKRPLAHFFDELNLWRMGLAYYAQRHVAVLARWFESQKDTVVDILIARRGMYQRPFMHFSIIVLFVSGVLAAPILADTYPGAKISQNVGTFTPPSAVLSSLDLTDDGVETQVSQKPRDQILEYKVETGDTLSGIADKFGVSVQSHSWANNMFGTDLSIEVIGPQSPVLSTVREGEAVYTISKI